MKRHAALIPLSHDHQNALARALRLRKAADRDDAARAEEADSFVAFFSERIEPHFAEEERVLDRALAQAPSTQLAAAREQLLDQHRWLRDRHATLDAQRAAGQAPDAQLLLETGQRLTDHIRFEERELFELLQQQLADRLHELVDVD